MTDIALEKSIKHWEQIDRIVKASIGGAVHTRWSGIKKVVCIGNHTFSIWADACALCKQHHHTGIGSMCANTCVVKYKTQRGGCDGTPWFRVQEALRGGVVTREAGRATGVMVKFLKSLRKTVKEMESNGEWLRKI